MRVTRLWAYSPPVMAEPDLQLIANPESRIPLKFTPDSMVAPEVPSTIQKTLVGNAPPVRIISADTSSVPGIWKMKISVGPPQRVRAVGTVTLLAPPENE